MMRLLAEIIQSSRPSYSQVDCDIEIEEVRSVDR